MANTLHIYTRVSSTIQETQGTSLQSQEECGIAKAKELGFEYKLWNEGGRSSRYEDLHNRPILRKLMLDIEDGKIEHLFVFNTDRLSRNQKVWGGIRWKLKENRVKLHTPSGAIDLSSPMDELIIGILSEISQYDNALRSERSQIGKLKKVQSGYWHGGPPPFGYKISNGILVEHPHESTWVKRIYVQYLNDTPIVKIKAELESNGIEPRRKGTSWSLGSIQKILKNTIYFGQYHYRDKKLNEEVLCHCPALITEPMWHLAQNKRNNTLKRKGQINKTKYFYMLRDFMYCAHCGGFISARKCNNNREQHYYCASNERNWKINPPEDTQKWKRNKGCDMTKALNVLRTDEIVWDAILKTLSAPTTLHDQLSSQLGIHDGYRKRRATSRKQIQAYEAQLNVLDASLIDIETDYRMGKVAERIYDRVIDNLHTERQSVLERLEQASMRYNELNNEGVWVSKVQSLVVDIDRLQTFNKRKKKDWLSKIVDRIDVRYIHDAMEHEVSVAMKVPLFSDDDIGVVVGIDTDEPQYRYRTFHSTVTERGGSVSIKPGFSCDHSAHQNMKVFVKFVLKIRSTAFWVSNYSEYQYFLSNKIAEFRSDGWTYKAIAQWFVSNEFRTPRGKTFTDRHVHSIHKKRQIRDARFLREPVINISDVELYFDRSGGGL